MFKRKVLQKVVSPNKAMLVYIINSYLFGFPVGHHLSFPSTYIPWRWTCPNDPCPDPGTPAPLPTAACPARLCPSLFWSVEALPFSDFSQQYVHLTSPIFILFLLSHVLRQGLAYYPWPRSFYVDQAGVKLVKSLLLRSPVFSDCGCAPLRPAVCPFVRQNI